MLSVLALQVTVVRGVLFFISCPQSEVDQDLDIFSFILRIICRDLQDLHNSGVFIFLTNKQVRVKQTLYLIKQ